VLRKLLSKLTGSATRKESPAIGASPWESALLDQVKRMQPTDSLIGAKVGGKELAGRLVEAMKADGGVHVESLMCAAGALAGYSCQAAVRAKNRALGRDEVALLTVASLSDGGRLYFGDPLNRYLAEDELSVWSLSAGGAQMSGCNDFPDLAPIFQHSAASAGTAAFGIPRLPEGHPIHAPPRHYLERLWPQFAPMVERFCTDPDHRPLLFGFCIQNLMTQTKAVLNPCTSLQIVMESAIPMSKVDLVAI
jgi:hypothetical protein